MQLWGQVLQQKAHPALNGLGTEDVVVIQHEGKIASTTLHEVIGKHGQHGFWRCGLRGAEQRKGQYISNKRKGEPEKTKGEPF